jgi:hypothetical protein
VQTQAKQQKTKKHYETQEYHGTNEDGKQQAKLTLTLSFCAH